MRRYLLLFLLAAFNFLFAGKSFAQTYSNSWINYSQPYYKFKLLNDSSIYMIPYATLQAAGLSSVPGNQFQLYKNGKQVPLYVTTTGALSANDYIEFLGTRNDGWVDSGLYMKGGWANTKLSMFTDSSAYYLTYNSEKNLRYTLDSNLLNAPLDTVPYCLYTIEQVYGKRNYSYYWEGYYVQVLSDGTDLFLPEWDNCEGFLDANDILYYVLPGGVQGGNPTISYTFNAPHVYTSGPPTLTANVNGEFCGYSPGLHQVHLGIGTTSLYNVPNFSNIATATFSYNISQGNFSQITSATPLFYSCKGSVNGAYDEEVMANMQLQYPRLLNFDNNSVVHFMLPGSSAPKQFLAIYNYNNKGTTPLIFDLTNLIMMRGKVSSNNDSAYFNLPGSQKDRNVIITSQSPADIATINSLQKITFTDYTNPANEGDFIIISNPVLYNDGQGHNYVQDYADFKNTCGYHAIVVNINQLYDQFAYGVQRHPLSIRNFALYARQHWTIKPKYILLIGKGAVWEDQGEGDNFTDNSAYIPICLVPTYGTPGADELFTATNYDPTPAIPVGRISTTNPADIGAYLQKVKDFVSAQTTTPSLQTIANKLWTKDVLHFGGGTDADEQLEFQSYLSNYQRIIQGTLFGAKVTSFYKTSPNPIQQATSQSIYSDINNGVSLITFFGHSSANSFDFSVDNPANLNNYQKYPMILSNGCYLGNIFLLTPGVSEQYVNIPNKGAIAFVASTFISQDYSTFDYSEGFYTDLCNLAYHGGIGDVIMHGIRYNVDTIYNAYAIPLNMPGAKLSVEQMVLNGDPSLSLNTHPKPDYDLEASTVHFSPSVITAANDTFDLIVYPTNLGMAINDSIYISVTRTFPSGNEAILYQQKIKAPYYQDSMHFKVYTDSTIGYGLNKFTVTIDSKNQVDEITKVNNSVTIQLFINGADLLPAYPYDYSIVNAQNITNNKGLVLKACTVNPFAAPHKYDIQVDTTALFNSHLLQTYSTTQSGGVVKWKPSITLHDSTVYYWRTAYDTLYSGQYNWHTYSFIYLPQSSPGWNQSHLYQYLNDNFANIYDSTDRKFHFVHNNKSLFAETGVTNIGSPAGTLPNDQIYYSLNSFIYLYDNDAYGPSDKTTFMIAVFDSATGLPWTNTCQPPYTGNGQYQSNNPCIYSNDGTGIIYGFFYSTLSAANQAILAKFINTDIPKGDYVLGFSIDQAGLPQFGSTLLNALKGLGCTRVDTTTFDRPYMFFAKKGGGKAYPTTEILADSALKTISGNFDIKGNWDEGYVQSPEIGPAAQWSSFHWKHHALQKPSTDSASVTIFGINNTGAQTLLYKAFTGTDLALNFINPKLYPQIMVQENTTDTTNKTPAQLNYWRVNYQPVPDAALNPSTYLSVQHIPITSFRGDSLQQGQPLALGVDVDNITDYNMDSLWMKYTVSTTSGSIMSSFVKNHLLGANDSLHVNLNYATNGNTSTGVDNVLMEANPYEHHQPEEYHYNNLGDLPFLVKKNTTNPILDVTFDGINILNNDIVSAKPDILISLKDKNKYLPLIDTSFVSIYIETPAAPNTPVRINYRNNPLTILFTPSPPGTGLTSSNNICTVNYKPDFTVDGTYTLIVQAHDSSGNVSGANPYQIAFEVINKEMISSILNYPNPFTTSTRFVFTLTGSQVPSFFKIEIMTITGKIVKEITQNNIGPLHIGTNISQYAWNGTDQFGNQLGNGLYLYHVVASINGQSLAHYDSGADQYITSGFGKMYLLK